MAKGHPKRKTRQPVSQEAPPAEVEAFFSRLEQVVQGETAPEDAGAVAAEANRLSGANLGPGLTRVARSHGERAVPLLSALARSDLPEVAAAAVDALGAVRHPAAAGALLALAEAEEARAVRKEARRSLFRLRAAGVEVPETPVEAPATTKGRVLVSRVSSVDGRGTRVAILATEGALGAATLVAMLLNDERGIIDGVGDHLSHSELARKVESMERGLPSIAIAEVPPDYVRQAILEAHEVNRSAGQAVPSEFYRWRGTVGQPAATYEHEPVYDVIDPAAVRWNPNLLEDSGRLVSLPEFATWVLPAKDVEQALREASRLSESHIILPGRAQEDPRRDVAERFVGSYFTDAVRRKYKVRLERTAYVFARNDRLVDARLAVAAALALDPAANVPVSRQPFPVMLARLTLEVLSEEDMEKRERSGGLLLPP